MRADPSLWRIALANSVSGKKLRRLLGERCFEHPNVTYLNTTPAIGVGSSSKLPPDPGYARRKISEIAPDVLVACGKQAEELAKDIWQGPLLIVPHPACRVLTNALYLQARRFLRQRFSRRIAFRQLVGSFSIEPV